MHEIAIGTKVTYVGEPDNPKHPHPDPEAATIVAHREPDWYDLELASGRVITFVKPGDIDSGTRCFAVVG